MLAIKNNIMSTTAARHLGDAYSALAKSVERLSSGLRVVSAKDDAAGMAVRELLRADMAVLEQATRNTQDGISMLQTMEAAMAVIDKNLIRMKQLAEQAATGSYSDAQRLIMDNEFQEMAAEIERVAKNTKFNGIAMLDDSEGSVSIHVGTEATIDIEKVDMTPAGLGINALNIQTAAAATTALGIIGSAIETKESARAAFGYKMNRLESTVEILEVQIENLQAAESRISDVDVASEMARLTSTQVLAQAGVAMLAQANAMPHMALTLLR